MKKFLLTAATAAAALTAFSADKFYVIMKDGSVESYPTEKVDSISFNDPQIAKIMGFNDMAAKIVQLEKEIAALKSGAGVQDTSVSDLRYFIINDKEVKVTGFNNGSSDLVIPEKTILNGKEYTVVGIGSEAFKDLEIKSVTLPKTLKKIGDESFSGCESLTSIEIPSSVTSIGWGTFTRCSSLTSIEIPSSVTSIGWGAFRRSGLTSIEIPSSVTVIDEEVFEDCSSLTSVVIPSSVTSIGILAFGGCESLTSIEIPSSVTSIGSGAFRDCENLDVVIDNAEDNVEVVCAFNHCKSVKWTKGSSPKPDPESQINVVASPKIQVEAGGEYEAINEALDLNFTFKVVETEGSYLMKNQVVTITIDGYDGELTLSDVGAGYLMYDGSVFTIVQQVTAIVNAKNVVASLACASSNADYTITSATVNDKLNALGATETKFRKKK